MDLSTCFGFHVIKVLLGQKVWILFLESSSKGRVNVRLENIVAVTKRGLLASEKPLIHMFMAIALPDAIVLK